MFSATPLNTATECGEGDVCSGRRRFSQAVVIRHTVSACIDSRSLASHWRIRSHGEDTSGHALRINAATIRPFTPKYASAATATGIVYYRLKPIAFVIRHFCCLFYQASHCTVYAIAGQMPLLVFIRLSLKIHADGRSEFAGYAISYWHLSSIAI